MTNEPVWQGAEQLKGLLVPIDSLQPFPGNPRVHDVGAYVASFKRFGQLKPLVVDGDRIVAGHGGKLAGKQLHWTHIAVFDHHFASEDEQRAFLMADNRVPDLGGFDDVLLAKQLEQLAAHDTLEGTGYTNDDLADLMEDLVRRSAPPEPTSSPLDKRGQRSHRDPGIKEVVLSYHDERLHEFEIWTGIVQRETGTNSTSDAVFEGMRIAAQQLNA